MSSDKKASEDLPNIAGKVIWSPSASGWAVTYTNRRGTRSTAFKGLKVYSSMPDGQPVSPRSYQLGKRTTYIQAIQMYNEIDCSNGDRIPYAANVISGDCSK
jgi:hypothetical protein